MQKFFIILLFLFHHTVYAQTITIGTLNFDPPFEMAADNQGHFYGFEIDLMSAMCQSAGLTCRFKGMDFSDLFTELLARRIDVAMAAISITPDRQQNFLFSLPYMASSGQFMAKKTTPTFELQKIQEKRVGVELGTLYKSFIEQRFGRAVRVTEYKNLQDLLAALDNDQIDLVLVDTATAQYWSVNNAKTIKTVGQRMNVGTGYGIMANLNQQPLIDALNKALLQLQNNGTYIAVYRRYFTHMSP